MKKFIALLLCMAMIAALAACAPAVTTTSGTTGGTTSGTTSGTTGETTKEAPKPVKWMMYQVEAGMNMAEPNLKIYQRINEYANVKIEPMVVPADTYVDKFSTTFASGDVPDLVLSSETLNLVNEDLGPAGLLVPIGDHLDKIPSLKKYLDKYKDQIPMITATDGKIYVIPWITDFKPEGAGLMMREDILKAGNFDPASIKTTDDLYAAFKVLQEQNDGEPVLNCRFGLEHLQFMMHIFGGGYDIRWNPDTKVWFQSAITDNTKAGVTFLNTLYEEGILAKDWASNTDELWEASFRGGELYSSYDNMMQLSAMTLAEGQKMIYIVPPTYQGKIWPRPYDANINQWVGNIISSKSKAIDNILMIMEFFFNDANQTFIQYGEEGVTFVTRPDGLKAYIEGNVWYGSTGALSQEYGCGWMLTMVAPFERTFCEYLSPTDLTPSPWIPAYNAYADAVWTYTNPIYQFNTEELDRLNAIKPALETYIQESLTQFISSVRSLDKWDEFVQTVKDMSSDEIVEIYNTATTRTNK